MCIAIVTLIALSFVLSLIFAVLMVMSKHPLENKLKTKQDALVVESESIEQNKPEAKPQNFMAKEQTDTKCEKVSSATLQ